MSNADFFLQEKPVRALINIYHNSGISATNLSDKIDTTYSHTNKIVNELVERGYVVKSDDGDGRTHPLDTTEKGKELAKEFRDVATLLDLDEVMEKLQD